MSKKHTEPFKVTKREKFLLDVMAYVLADELGYPMEALYTPEHQEQRRQERIKSIAARLQQRISKITTVSHS